METALEQVNNPRKAALTNTLIWSVINIAIFLMVYYVKPDLLGSGLWKGLDMVIGIGLAIYFCIDLRKKAGGYWTFKEALGSIFILFFIQAVIFSFFTIIFAKYIEPEYLQRMKEISASSAERMYSSMRMEQEKIDELVSFTEAQMDKQFNPGIKELLFSVSIIALMYFIGALIFAAIFKKDPPLSFRTAED